MSTEAPIIPASSSSSAAARPSRILVIDDHESITDALRTYLSGLGYDVDCAHEFEEAIALIHHVRYSLVITDLHLEATSGVEGLSIIDELHERCPWARIILLTGYGTPRTDYEARRRGVSAILHKPKPLREIGLLAASLMA